MVGMVGSARVDEEDEKVQRTTERILRDGLENSRRDMHESRTGNAADSRSSRPASLVHTLLRAQEEGEIPPKATVQYQGH